MTKSFPKLHTKHTPRRYLTNTFAVRTFGVEDYMLELLN